jgi:PAS domain S-box-containing protein
VLANNVTDRVNAEEELKHAHYLMQYIIEHNQSAVAVHDKNLKYVYVSQSYLDQYGITEKNIIGKHHYDVFPDLPEKWRDVHRRCLNGEIIRKEEDPYFRANGKTDWTNWKYAHGTNWMAQSVELLYTPKLSTNAKNDGRTPQTIARS